MGTALPSQLTFPRLALKKKMFRIGWVKINDYVIRESDKGGIKRLSTCPSASARLLLTALGSLSGKRGPMDSE